MTEGLVRSPWTEGTVETLRKLIADGLTASQIASEIGGVSRNAVIGKVHRMGLALRTPWGVQHQERRQPQKRTIGSIVSRIHQKRTAKTIARAALPSPEEPRCATVELMELEDHHCRWPIGEENYRFCGGQKLWGPSSYCPYHERVSRSGVVYGPRGVIYR